jgi:membrane protein
VGLVKETGKDWIDDHAARLAAALAYYTLLSIAPLLVLAISVVGLAIDEQEARGKIATELGAVVGPQAAESIRAVIENAHSPTRGVVGTVVGTVALLLGASGVFGELQSTLNTIWEVEPKSGRGLVGAVKDRFFSFTMVVGVAFLLLVSLVVSTALAAAGQFFAGALPGGEALWQVINLLLSVVFISGLFAVIFKVVPDVQISWRDVWPGAVATAVLFTLGKWALGLYLGKSSLTSSYGAAGSLVALAAWVYYAAQILFLGAEFTQVLARHRGARIEPSADAVAVGAKDALQRDTTDGRPPAPVGR